MFCKLFQVESRLYFIALKLKTEIEQEILDKRKRSVPTARVKLQEIFI